MAVISDAIQWLLKFYAITFGARINPKPISALIQPTLLWQYIAQKLFPLPWDHRYRIVEVLLTLNAAFKPTCSTLSKFGKRVQLSDDDMYMYIGLCQDHPCMYQHAWMLLCGRKRKFTSYFVLRERETAYGKREDTGLQMKVKQGEAK